MITNRLQQENSNGSDLNRNPLRLLEQDLLRTACLNKKSRLNVEFRNLQPETLLNDSNLCSCQSSNQH